MYETITRYSQSFDIIFKIIVASNEKKFDL